MSREIFEDKRKHGLDVELDFFNKWSVLSGGTFSLLIPLVQSLDRLIIFRYLLTIGAISVLISLLSSVLGLFSATEWIRRIDFSWPNFPTDRVFKFFRSLKNWSRIIALLAYIIGVVFIALFINKNIF
ncbi:MAG TPA: hypothetical protein VHE10_02755 [Candidatus Paceibacterota bacterium]|nr:hypothetical protein [Candidatus Paceibacterota bacterium]